MSFTGKATYSAGTTLPESAEDVSDLIGVVSPYETPLLDAIGDPLRATTSTHHEWLEDELLPNKDIVTGLTGCVLCVEHLGRFRVGDQLQGEGSRELMLVTAITEHGMMVVRGYAGTTERQLMPKEEIHILGNAAMEGADKPQPRWTKRLRRGNHTQIFTAEVEVKADDVASSQLGLGDEMDYQKQERLRGLLRDLENTVINGGRMSGDEQARDKAAKDGSRTSLQEYSKTRTKMEGIISQLSTNVFGVGDEDFPAGNHLDAEKINHVFRKMWESSNGSVDHIVVGGFQKRRINAMLNAARDDSRDMVSIYESDYGVCRVVCTRWMPPNAALLLDSSRVNVLPLAGRSFHFKPLASSGDYECGELIGEYTLELKREASHGLITGLSTS